MDIVDRLTSELMKLRDSDESPQSDPSLTERYKTAARNYASMENTVSVLSDLKSNVSHIYYGRFAETLGIGNRPAGEETIDSIWERRIMELIQPNDLHDKHLNELRFFHFIKAGEPTTTSSTNCACATASAISCRPSTVCSTFPTRQTTACGLPCVCTGP